MDNRYYSLEVTNAEEIYKELGIARENLALNKEVSVSGLEVNDGRFTADKAVDGIVTKESRVSFAKDFHWSAYLCQSFFRSHIKSGSLHHMSMQSPSLLLFSVCN